MGWIEILPGYTSLFHCRGWDSVAPFLGWTGILVNKHRQRQVEQVRLEPEANSADSASETFYLKKESAVSWRDRFRNAWHGFGWCSTAVREGAILQALREAGVGCPEVVALGEDQRQAFVLTRDAAGMTELRAFLPTLSSGAQCRLADALGRELARMHDAGFDHPDLFAKHILVATHGATFRFCLLDWQRGRRRRSVPWRLRCRDLAVLDATLHLALASDRLRLRCLRAYTRSVRKGMPLGRAARRIRPEATRLRENRNIREIGQLPVPARDQQFVAHCEGRLLVVQSYYERLGNILPEWLRRISEPGARGEAARPTVVNPAGSENLLIQTWPASASAWDLPPLAHTLFRLQRFGVPVPRLVAVGCTGTCAFLVAESTPMIPFESAFAKAGFPVRSRMLQQAGWIIRQIHEAGYYLPPGDTWRRRLGVVRSTGAIVFARVEPLPRDATPWYERAPTELDRQKIRLTRSEQLRFLQGYLQQRPKARLSTGAVAWERQVVS